MLQRDIQQGEQQAGIGFFLAEDQDQREEQCPVAVPEEHLEDVRHGIGGPHGCWRGGNRRLCLGRLRLPLVGGRGFPAGGRCPRGSMCGLLRVLGTVRVRGCVLRRMLSLCAGRFPPFGGGIARGWGSLPLLRVCIAAAGFRLPAGLVLHGARLHLANAADGILLGNWLYRQQRIYEGRAPGRLSTEQREKLCALFAQAKK